MVKGRPLFLGIFAGYYVVQAICAALVFGVSSLLPNFLHVLQYVGAAYILWLAWHIACSKPQTDEMSKSASFMQGFMLQFVNVKINLFGITALTAYITAYSNELHVFLLFEMIIATIGTIATITWIGLGVVIQKYYFKYYRIINIILALTLLQCVYSILRMA